MCPGHDKDTVDTFIVTIKTEILKIYLRMRSVLRQESVRSGPSSTQEPQESQQEYKIKRSGSSFQLFRSGYEEREAKIWP